MTRYKSVSPNFEKKTKRAPSFDVANQIKSSKSFNLYISGMDFKSVHMCMNI